MTAAFLSIAITTLSVTTISAAIGTVARARLRFGSSTTRSTQARTSRQFRRQATPVYRIPHSARRIGPQYRGALARARIVRAQTAYLAITTARRRQIVRAARLSGSSAGVTRAE